jgi:ribosomal protein S18 acetylase RimI-like enzyme
MAHHVEKSPASESNSHPLDTVIWRALTSAQAGVAEGDGRARRYPSAIAPFAAAIDTSPVLLLSLLPLLPDGDRIALFTTREVEPPVAFTVIRRDSVDQMVLETQPSRSASGGVEISELRTGDVAEMLELASRTEPGPFGPRTIELGRYIGVRQGRALAAMAGERMRLTGFTEISAVCVDPAHRGRGFAADLVGALASSISDRSETPFLHVFSSNVSAVALYRKLGFVLRRRMHLAVLARAGEKAAPTPVEN